jgi:membrane-bound inhibitor of C-type lysozyme
VSRWVVHITPWELARKQGIFITEYDFNAYCSAEKIQQGRVRCNCERSDTIEVEFSSNGKATLYQDDGVIELPQAPTASGFHYTNGKIGIRGKGDEVMLEIGRMAPIPCRADNN